MLASDMCLSPSAAAINSSIVGWLESNGAFIWISSVHGSSEPREVASSRSQKHQGVAACAFFLGFIHGFGFAGALRDIGLPQDALLIALAFFNIGVEIGQVAIVAIVVPLLLGIDRLSARAPAAPARRPALVYTISALIAGLGGYWFIERTLLA